MKKKLWISIIAGVAAVAAAAIAVAAVIRKKTKSIAQELDFEPDDDYFDPIDDEEEASEEEDEGEVVETEISTSAEEEPMEVPEE